MFEVTQHLMMQMFHVLKNDAAILEDLPIKLTFAKTSVALEAANL